VDVEKLQSEADGYRKEAKRREDSGGCGECERLFIDNSRLEAKVVHHRSQVTELMDKLAEAKKGKEEAGEKTDQFDTVAMEKDGQCEKKCEELKQKLRKAWNVMGVFFWRSVGIEMNVKVSHTMGGFVRMR
jgi:hypothetical protein